MRYSAFLFLCGMLLSRASVAQHTFDPASLKISYRITGTKGDEQLQADLTVANTGKTALPASGWQLYFNYNHSIGNAGKLSPVSIEQLNGNLFRISPRAGFKAIAAGDVLTLPVILDGGIRNRGDVPEGFYLVWKDAPNQGFAVKEVTVFPLLPKPGADTFAQVIFRKNALVEDIPLAQLPPIFPTPASYTLGADSFLLSGTLNIIPAAGFEKEAALLAHELQAIPGVHPVVAGNSSGKRILLNPLNTDFEAYTLTVNSESITIGAATTTGIFYGIQSLKSLLPSQGHAIRGITVTDTPRFGYRGLMIDVARNFQTKAEILRMLDLMALYKLNVFHFHLNDDEGWRLEIAGLPELTALGAKRGHTLNSNDRLPAAYGSGPDTTLYGSGYYTRRDFIDILQYAQDRHIEVVPEIETPGHARAAIKAMDARYRRLMAAGNKAAATEYLLRDYKDASVYHTAQRWNDNVMDVSMPSVYHFIEKVADEVISLYKEAGVPLHSLHMGGDEVPKGAWEKSPAFLSLQKTNPAVKQVSDLWAYYFTKVNTLLKARQLYLSGWEEIALRKIQMDGDQRVMPNPDFVGQDFRVYVWNNLEGAEDLGYRLANAGYRVVLTGVTHFYYDMAYYDTYAEPGYYWGGFKDIDKPFSFIPFDFNKNLKEDYLGHPLDKAYINQLEKLTAKGESHIAGIQASVWSETIKGPERLEYMLLPRLQAVAERAWAPDPVWGKHYNDTIYQHDWSVFLNVLGKKELPKLDHYAGGFYYRIPSPGAIIVNGAVEVNLQLPGFTIRYTTNGDEPTINSSIYTQPVATKGTIKLAAFNGAGRHGNITTIVHQ